MKGKIKYLIVFLIFLIFNLICSPINLDEVWNYGFANNIFNGLIPYRDFNMVIPPFYPFLMQIPFHLFGSSMLVLHTFNALILTILFYFLEKIIDNKAWLLLIFMFFPHNFSFPNYNTFLFVLLVIIIYLEEKFKSTNKDIYNYLIGFFLAITVLTKHSMGFFLILPSLYYIKNLKIILKRLVSFLIPILIFFFYLCFTKTLGSFVDLCILGLFDFSKNNKGFNIYLIVSLIMIIVTILFIKKDRSDIKNYYVLAFYSIVIPIVDIYHFCDAFRAFLIIPLSKIKKRYFNYEIFAVTIIVVLGIFNFNYYAKRDFTVKYPNDIKHFNYRFINKESYLFTKEMSSFLNKNEDKKIIFLSANSYYFKIINDIPCNKFDLINEGNWGYNGSKKLLSEIKKNKDALFLIDEKELAYGSQTDHTALKYVINNAKKIDTVYLYDIYKF